MEKYCQNKLHSIYNDKESIDREIFAQFNKLSINIYRHEQRIQKNNIDDSKKIFINQVLENMHNTRDIYTKHIQQDQKKSIFVLQNLQDFILKNNSITDILNEIKLEHCLHIMIIDDIQDYIKNIFTIMQNIDKVILSSVTLNNLYDKKFFNYKNKEDLYNKNLYIDFDNKDIELRSFVDYIRNLMPNILMLDHEFYSINNKKIYGFDIYKTLCNENIYIPIISTSLAGKPYYCADDMHIPYKEIINNKNTYYDNLYKFCISIKKIINNLIDKNK